MSEVNCIYCGQPMAGELSHCPHCGAPSHFQKRGFRAGAQGRFVVLFAALVVICIVLAFWLPR